MTTQKSAAPRLADRYIRCEDFAARIEGVELAPEIWAVFAQLTQSRNANELAEHLQLDVEAVNASLRRLVRRKLVRKHVLGWRDYTATQAAAPATPLATLPATPPATVIQPVSTTPAPTDAPATPSRSPIISFRISNSTTPARIAPAVSLRIAPAQPSRLMPAPSSPRSSAATPVNPSGMKLRPVLDAIGAKAGGGVAGQLLVYRVFLQIPTELMQAAGLHSLSLVDDQFTVQHPPLRAALADAARRHADVDIDALVAA